MSVVTSTKRTNSCLHNAVQQLVDLGFVNTTSFGNLIEEDFEILLNWRHGLERVLEPPADQIQNMGMCARQFLRAEGGGEKRVDEQTKEDDRIPENWQNVEEVSANGKIGLHNDVNLVKFEFMTHDGNCGNDVQRTTFSSETPLRPNQTSSTSDSSPASASLVSNM